MPAIANIVLADGQTTPVNKTFAPAKTLADYALFEDRSAGIYIGYNKLTMSLKRPTGPSKEASRNLKLSVLIETPKMETVSNNTVSGIAPAPTVSYRPTVELLVNLPERCTLQDRKDLQALVKNALANSFVTAAFESYELPY
jgi:hypothetical protein